MKNEIFVVPNKIFWNFQKLRLCWISWLIHNIDRATRKQLRGLWSVGYTRKGKEMKRISAPINNIKAFNFWELFVMSDIFENSREKKPEDVFFFLQLYS